ncbi:MAG: sulfotransferase [Hyphomonadaceae bacterium]
MATTEEMLREASALRREGRLVDAEAAYRRLLALSPNLPDSWFNLAWLQRRVGKPDHALASYTRAIELGVSAPEEARLNRAVIYTEDLRDDASAERELAAALKINPAYVPALLNAANLAEDRGDRAEAVAFYDRVLARDPQNWEALARRANCMAFADPKDPFISKLAAALRRPELAAPDRASLGFALGRALDRVARYDEAFVAYVAANAAAGQGAPVYNRAAQEGFIDALIASPARVLSAPQTGRPPIFIVGMFRSGSTLVEQVLSAHPRVTMGGELSFLPQAAAADLAPFPAGMEAASDARLSEVARRYLDAVGRAFPNADIVTDKRPENFIYVGLIKTLFPKAKIIHTVRDPLDNCLSAYFLHLDPSMSYARDLADIAHYYREQSRLMAHWKSRFGPDIHTFDYDAFVSAPREQLEPLLSFCGLDWNDALLSFHVAQTSVKTASVWQVREPLYQRSSGRWRHYAAHLAPVRAQLSDLSPEGVR